MEKRNLSSQKLIEVAIIGAGPYGLSIAAHLKALGVAFRIFGKPMSLWANHMPEGMRLKSEGFASWLYDPKVEFTLAEYCRLKQLPYRDSGLPVPLETFVAYGLEFQKRYVPGLEERLVYSVRRVGDLFEVTLDDGETFHARNVVCAVGVSYYARMAPELAALGNEYVSHSSVHSRLDRFRGKRVAVVGGGSSAGDLAALLRGKGADVQMIVRAARVRFHDPPPARRGMKDRLLNPSTGIGPGLRQLFYVKAPHVFRRLPEEFRLRKVKTTLGPAPGWFVKEEVVGKVPMHVNARIRAAVVEDGAVTLRWTGANGEEEVGRFDHVISATGFEVDVARLEFLSEEIRNGLRTTGKAPALSARFESSVSGLYFVGVSSANAFGPMMRFAYGAGFTTKRVARRLAAVSRRARRTALPIAPTDNAHATEIAAGALRES